MPRFMTQARVDQILDKEGMIRSPMAAVDKKIPGLISLMSLSLCNKQCDS